MIPKEKFPDLSSIANRWIIGKYLAFSIVGKLYDINNNFKLIALTFFRLIDGSLLDYSLAHESYYNYWEKPELGGKLPISAALIPCYHHIENCISNTVRAIEMCDSLRKLPLSNNQEIIIDRMKWRLATQYFKEIKSMRNAIQHWHNDLRQGKHNAAAILYNDEDSILLGDISLNILNIANSLVHLHDIAENVFESWSKK